MGCAQRTSSRYGVLVPGYDRQGRIEQVDYFRRATSARPWKRWPRASDKQVDAGDRIVEGTRIADVEQPLHPVGISQQVAEEEEGRHLEGRWVLGVEGGLEQVDGLVGSSRGREQSCLGVVGHQQEGGVTIDQGARLRQMVRSAIGCARCPTGRPPPGRAQKKRSPSSREARAQARDSRSPSSGDAARCAAVRQTAPASRCDPKLSRCSAISTSLDIRSGSSSPSSEETLGLHPKAS